VKLSPRAAGLSEPWRKRSDPQVPPSDFERVDAGANPVHLQADEAGGVRFRREIDEVDDRRLVEPGADPSSLRNDADAIPVVLNEGDLRRSVVGRRLQPAASSLVVEAGGPFLNSGRLWLRICTPLLSSRATLNSNSSSKSPNSRSVQRNVLGWFGFVRPTMQPSSTRYSASPPRRIQPLSETPSKRSIQDSWSAPGVVAASWLTAAGGEGAGSSC
jgi:hypothetical protein